MRRGEPSEEIAAIAKAIAEKRDGIEVPEALINEQTAGEKFVVSVPLRPVASKVQIAQMSVVQRVKLALRGNRQARHVLLRDVNQLIRSMVLRNPRITEDEILEIAKSPQTDEKLLRELAENRDWIAIYSVRAALVENPKMPFAEAIRLIKTLSHHTLHMLAKSKNVPTVVAGQARRILSQREVIRGSVSVRGSLFSPFDDRDDDRSRPGKPPRRRRSIDL